MNRHRSSTAAAALLALSAVLCACAPTPAAPLVTPGAEAVPASAALVRVAGAQPRPCSRPALMRPAAALTTSGAAALDVELAGAMWRYCVAAAHGSRHACLHDLMLACG